MQEIQLVFGLLKEEVRTMSGLSSPIDLHRLDIHPPPSNNYPYLGLSFIIGSIRQYYMSTATILSNLLLVGGVASLSFAYYLQTKEAYFR